MKNKDKIEILEQIVLKSGFTGNEHKDDQEITRLLAYTHLSRLYAKGMYIEMTRHYFRAAISEFDNVCNKDYGNDPELKERSKNAIEHCTIRLMSLSRFYDEIDQINLVAFLTYKKSK